MSEPLKQPRSLSVLHFSLSNCFFFFFSLLFSLSVSLSLSLSLSRSRSRSLSIYLSIIRTLCLSTCALLSLSLCQQLACVQSFEKQLTFTYTHTHTHTYTHTHTHTQIRSSAPSRTSVSLFASLLFSYFCLFCLFQIRFKFSHQQTRTDFGRQASVRGAGLVNHKPMMKPCPYFTRVFPHPHFPVDRPPPTSPPSVSDIDSHSFSHFQLADHSSLLS
jgi:hypothetical protein